MPGETPVLRDGPEGGPTLLLAHGAGAAMDSPFMQAIAAGLAESGIRVVRFEFPYMRSRRELGTRRPPDRQPVLLASYREVVEQERRGSEGVFIGGKSMGGRMASMISHDPGISGLVCLGYPFHAPGRPESPRIEHLKALQTPALILQGTRDSFGPRDEVEAYELSPAIRIHWLEDGDHDFKPRAASGRTQRQNREEAIAATAAFVLEVAATGTLPAAP
ncbi:alpha/beta hydrolase [bacterium SCGC AG-212-C10]|nr:alpha/beta hydrolase [bacterium SCGC AG-212-C10]